MKSVFTLSIFLLTTFLSSNALSVSQNNIVYSASHCTLSSMDGDLTWGYRSWKDDKSTHSVYSSFGLHNQSKDKFFQVYCPITNLQPDSGAPISAEVRFKNTNLLKEGTQDLNHFYGDWWYTKYPIGCHLSSRSLDGKYVKYSAFKSFANVTGSTSKTIPSLTPNKDSTIGLTCRMGPDSKFYNYLIVQ